MRAQQAFEVLEAKRCICGGVKTVGAAFCRNCNAALPADLQRELERYVGLGFEAAYAKAGEVLTVMGRRQRSSARAAAAGCECGGEG